MITKTAEELAREKKDIEEEGGINPLLLEMSPLSSHIHEVYTRNREARRDSGVEEDILMGMRMINREYSASERALVKEQGGSDIYMPIGATKIRATTAWIKDILMSAKEWPFAIYPTTVPDLPKELSKKIEDSIQREFEEFIKDPKSTEELAENFKLQEELRRDMNDLINDEKKKEALYAFKLEENKIKDQLEEGEWSKALAEFIEDFTAFPTAFMKGPLIYESPSLTWKNGKPVRGEKKKFYNKRVNPLDMYPSPSANSIQEGDLIEVLRTRPEDLAAMKGKKGWFSDEIDKVIDSGLFRGALWSTEIEDERADLERRGDSIDAYRDILMGFHYHGPVKREYLEDIIGTEALAEFEDQDYYEIEAIVYGPHIVKAKVNTDPLLRRPYYAASFQNRPGSIWGISLPHILDPIQRFCNANARALVNNMALSARPIMGLNVDRLADKGDISQLVGGDIVQFTNDPYGANSSPLEFFSVPSNAAELLSLYNAFEDKADDATMIPKYAYGGQNVQGAAATAAGLAMLMESASKGIKEAIRHIDDGLIRPRVEFQFYWNMLNDPMEDFNGDIFVVAKGSDALAIKGAQELRRNEFLQATSNPVDMAILGKIARADILRVVANDLGIGENIVPNRFYLRKLEREEREMAQKMAEQGDRSLAATKLQVEGQVKMQQNSQQVELEKLKFDMKRHADSMQMQQQRLGIEAKGRENQLLTTLRKAEMDKDTDLKKIAASIVK